MVGFSLVTDPTSKEVDGNPEGEVQANLLAAVCTCTHLRERSRLQPLTHLSMYTLTF